MKIRIPPRFILVRNPIAFQIALQTRSARNAVRKHQIVWRGILGAMRSQRLSNFRNERNMLLRFVLGANNTHPNMRNFAVKAQI
ncbi:MAG TPA: hypothetical protein VF345_04360, partial [Chthoniobacterales bacterium]